MPKGTRFKCKAQMPRNVAAAGTLAVAALFAVLWPYLGVLLVSLLPKGALIILTGHWSTKSSEPVAAPEESQRRERRLA